MLGFLSIPLSIKIYFNHRAAFAPYNGSTRQQHHSAAANTRPRKRTQPAFHFPVKDTWTHEFFLLSSPEVERTPSIQDVGGLVKAGLGKKKIVFKDKHGGFPHLRDTLEAEYPKLKTQNGAFELLRADRGGPMRPLVLIPMKKDGYPIPYLKEVLTSHAVIYIRPVQSSLSMEEAESMPDEKQEFSECVNCHAQIALQDMRIHGTSCRGGSSNASQELSTDGFCTYSADTSTSNRSWNEELISVFPNATEVKINEACEKSDSLEEAAEILCEQEGKGEETEIPATNSMPAHKAYTDVKDFVSDLAFKVTLDDIMMTVNRDEIWKSSLIFYKKAQLDSTKLWRNLCVVFDGEDGLDAGAMKAEFFELLLEQITLRLFEGNAFSVVPVKDRSKGTLFKLAGMAVGHSIIQSGPSFNLLSKSVYHYMAGAEEDVVLSYTNKDDIPLNAGEYCPPFQ